MNKIIIFFHIYYVDLIDEYLWYLNNIKKTKYDFDFYVSICKEVSNINTINKLKEFDNRVNITECENQGADMGGFFASLRNNTIDFDLYLGVLYLHTKKSSQYGTEVSYTWRGELLNDILISSDLIEICIEKLKNNGIIGCSNCIFDITKSLEIFENEKLYYNLLCNILNIQHQNNSFFVVGTIFWANPAIFKIILNSSITQNNFKKTFAHFNLLEHGFERIFGNISAHLNLNVLGIKLDFKNDAYNRSFILFKHIKLCDNIFIFKINENIQFPNEKKINDIIKFKKRIKMRLLKF